MEMTPAVLIDPARLAARADSIDRERATAPVASVPREHGTVYLAAADESGMMVSFIQSNFWGFGSGVVVPGTGISLQNRGYGFTLAPGHPNRVAGGKRSYQTIIPGFLTQGDEPVMAFGVMGGHMQAQGHVQMTTRVVDYGQNPQTASDAPRWFVTEDGRLAVEAAMPASTVARFREMGHDVIHGSGEGAPATLFGGAQLIRRVDDGGYVAGSDHRKDGGAVGF
jgi:gamma-glutamyltranspeptidase/glutathione hydrolase